MKKLPLGKQHLEQFVKQNLIYVDKTPLIYRLVEEGNYYFLSRPRRFGKSLLVDTLRNIFLGNKQLFEGLWIYDKIDWKPHPVIHLDFSALSYKKQDLDEAISAELIKIAEHYQHKLEGINCKELLRELIEKLSKKAPVALLIDEYDKPITDYITDLQKANENREVLREFYGGLKYLGDKLRIVFITGIAKFTRVSLFSVLNNLTDITLRAEYATICGITREELSQFFEDYLQRAETELNISREVLLAQIKRMYDGYSWDGKNFVYNPFSLLNFFDERRFKDYWFKTGTPSFLIELIRKEWVQAHELESIQVEDTYFDTFNIERSIATGPLLFQTGYWTVKDIQFENYLPIYTLGYPNNEVKRAFLHNVIEAYTFKDETTVNVATLKIRQALRERDIEAFREQLNVLFSDISFHLFPQEKKDATKDRKKQEFLAWEGYFHTIIYLVLQYIGVYIKCEVTKHQGRLDAVIEVEGYLYIVEFKLEKAEEALQQIKEKEYAHSYRNIGKEIVLMGVAFDRGKREVKEIRWEGVG